MNRTAAQALGRLCHDVFHGRDQFGNRFCTEVCAVTATLKKHETVNRFEIATGDGSHSQPIGMTIVEIPDSRPGCFTAVHILDRVDENSRLARELARLLGASAASSHPVTSAGGGVPITLDAPRAGFGQTPDLQSSAHQLSARELDVLRGIASGQANKDVARSLHISVATTRNHVQHILGKLNVHSKLEAVALAFRNSWV
jgi:DNA-binding CsgD family transcriptional regulator